MQWTYHFWPGGQFLNCYNHIVVGFVLNLYLPYQNEGWLSYFSWSLLMSPNWVLAEAPLLPASRLPVFLLLAFLLLTFPTSSFPTSSFSYFQHLLLLAFLLLAFPTFSFPTSNFLLQAFLLPAFYFSRSAFCHAFIQKLTSKPNNRGDIHPSLFLRIQASWGCVLSLKHTQPTDLLKDQGFLSHELKRENAPDIYQL